MESNKTHLFVCLAASALITPVFAAPVHNHIELLFFQRAQAGELTSTNTKDCYDLALKNVHSRVLYFSNAPSKVVGHLTDSQFLTTLHHDQVKDHVMPNGVLNAYSQEGKEINWIGEFRDASYQQKHFHYTFCLLNKQDARLIQQGKLRAINLFIDPIHRWPP